MSRGAVGKRTNLDLDMLKALLNEDGSYKDGPRFQERGGARHIWMR